MDAGVVIVRALFFLLGALMGAYFVYLAEEIRLGVVDAKTIASGIILTGAILYFLFHL
jgi:hypothetical protein